MNRQSLSIAVPSRVLRRGPCRLLAAALAAGHSSAQAKAGMPLLRLPPGFKAEVYAKVPSARSPALGDDGMVCVGSDCSGKVYAPRISYAADST